MIYCVLIAFDKYFMSLKSKDTITLSVSIMLNSVSGLVDTYENGLYVGGTITSLYL